MAETFIDELEEITLEVARWGAKQVTEITEALAPDGRPFGTEKKTTDEQLAEYAAMRNDVMQWQLWIANKASQIANMLAGSGIDPEIIGTLNPVQIASQFCLDYSIRMEKLLEERMV